MRVYKRGTVYWFELVYEGQRYQKSTKVKNRRAAEDIASAFRTALAKGDVGIVERKRAPSFKQAMSAFLAWSKQEHRAHPNTAERYRYSSAALLRFFGDISIDRITPEDVERFKTARSSEEGSHTARRLRPATVNRELACLKALFNHAIKGNSNLHNPVRRVKFLAEQNQQERVLTFREQSFYLAACSDVLHDVATLILETGMRPEEVFTLRKSDVNVQENYLAVQRGKTPAARRRIALSATALGVLKPRLGAKKDSPYVFPNAKDAKRPLPNVHSAHRRAIDASKVAPFRLYDCRHTWATRAAEAGIDPVTLAAMLGHSRIQMVLRYAHPTQVHQTNAMHKLAEHNAARQMAEFGTASIQ